MRSNIMADVIRVADLYAHARQSVTTMSPTALRNMDEVEIVNIQHEKMDVSLVDILNKALKPPEGTPRSFPTLLLYDTRGLKIFEKITYVDDYYLTNAEIEILTSQAKRIVERLPDNAQLVELGSGSVVLAAPDLYGP